MRKIVLTLGLIAVTASFLMAQVAINPKVGINYYDISDESGEISTDGKGGFHLGLDLRFGDLFYIQPGLHYYSLDAEYIDEGPLDFLTDDIRLQSIRIPVTLGTSFLRFNDGNVKLRAQAGIVGLFPLNVDDNDFLIDTDDFRTTTFGAVAGIGMDLGILTLDITYDFGMTDTFNNDSNIDFNGRGNILSFSVGLVF